jgi:hypothetical protein
MSPKKWGWSFVSATLLVTLLMAADVIAGGGFFPSFPPDLGLTSFDTSGRLSAVVVLDPNGPVPGGTVPGQAPSTPGGTLGTIAISRPRVGTATAAFQVDPGSSLGELRFGCNLELTNARFLEFAPGVPGLPIGGPGPFANWLPADVTTKLFGELGIRLEDTSLTILAVPGVAQIVSQECVGFPRKNEGLELLPFADILDKLRIRPTPPRYPDRTIPNVTDPAQQWFPGFLVLEVKLGLWRAGAP